MLIRRGFLLRKDNGQCEKNSKAYSRRNRVLFYNINRTAQCSNRLEAEMPGFSFFAVSLLFLFAASFLSVMEPNSSAIE